MFKKFLFLFLVFLILFFWFFSKRTVLLKKVSDEEIIYRQSESLKSKNIEFSKENIMKLKKNVNNAIRDSLRLFTKNNYNLYEENAREKMNKSKQILLNIINNKEYTDDGKSRYFLAKIYLIMGEKEKAYNILKKVIELEKNDVLFDWNAKWANNARIILE